MFLRMSLSRNRCTLSGDMRQMCGRVRTFHQNDAVAAADVSEDRVMRRWFGAFFAATSLVALGEPASAGRFYVETANWFAYALTNSCIAANRPPVEYNFSPWNSLTLLAGKDGGYRVEVMFWPGL